MNLLQQYRNLGFEVRVSHTRQVNDRFCFNASSMTGEVVDRFLTRREYEETAQKAGFRLGFVSPKWGNDVLPTGGFTTVELTRNGQTFKGKFNFNGKQPVFVKKIGVAAAFGRAIKNMLHYTELCQTSAVR